MDALRENKLAIIAVAVLIGLSLISTVKVSTLSDLSSGVFLTFYIITMASASALSGSLIATQMYYKKQKKLYKDNVKKLDNFENDNKFQIAFCSKSIALHKELKEMDKKIQNLKKDK